jgi:hypothetical protein
VTHLSRQRKRNLEEIPIVAASEVGRAQTVNLFTGLKGQSTKLKIDLAEQTWEGRRDRVIVPYAKSQIAVRLEPE